MISTDDPTTQARFNMVECQLKPGGVRDPQITARVAQIPRDAFVAETARDVAYADRVVMSTAGEASRPLLSPLSFGLLAELAAISDDDILLDIGGGTGYAAAVLAGLAGTVIGLEDDARFGEKASAIWRELGVDNAVAVTGALLEGQAKQAPFDVIFVNGEIADVPESLLAQLEDGGRLVCVQRVDGAPRGVVHRRIGADFVRRVGCDMSAPHLAAFDPPPTFEF